MSQTADHWTRAVQARLSARLLRDDPRPIAVALSGGGDSIALLRLAADWAGEAGRPLLALTVDHGLNPDSPRWTAFAREQAEAIGADWRGLDWTGDKPTTGLPAAARRARHRLIADAARQAGARVILFGHTADDLTEASVMRAGGSTVGDPREWSPSPAWPEGRGLMLLRPMLSTRRADIRDWLEGQGASWLDDPANTDPRFARARARTTLQGSASVSSSPTARPTAPLSVRDGGVIVLSRDTPRSALAAGLVCAGGGDRLPRGDRLGALAGRLTSGADFTAVLAGARLDANADLVLLMREPGELARSGAAPVALQPGVETVWDGRFALTVTEPGWSVAHASGRLSALSDADRASLQPLPPAARAAMPVLIRDGSGDTRLAGEGTEIAGLVEQRLALALDTTPHEGALDLSTHGAQPCNDLFSGAELTGSDERSEGSRRE
ncbi:tRNA lysidine(34) synthetase TilS [Brevundimonas sp. NPDC092305]|uniref:tRNA lysidine(34) synthetase TilS n=1 Tax=Brevundimonas sp. NPDC092305 TaxID=3363957 RepID=UPI0038165492